MTAPLSPRTSNKPLSAYRHGAVLFQQDLPTSEAGKYAHTLRAGSRHVRDLWSMPSSGRYVLTVEIVDGEMDAHSREARRGQRGVCIPSDNFEVFA